MSKLPNKSYFRIDEVAIYFDISKRTIYQLIQQGEINAIQPAGCRALRISREEIERMKRLVIE